MSTFKVPAQEWEKLDQEQKNQIRGIMSSNNLLHEGDEIIPDHNLTEAKFEQLDSACTIACNVAQAAAVAACDGLGFGKGICVSLANAAGDACRSAC